MAINRKFGQIIIRKRNGNTEIFDLDKITASISRSGIPFTMAKDIAASINDALSPNSNYLAGIKPIYRS